MVSSRSGADPGGADPIAKNKTSPAESTESAPAVDEGAPPASGRGARESRLKDNPTQLLLTLACSVIIILGMHYAAGVLNPILVALFVVMGISPVVEWLRRRGVPSWLCITIVLICFLAIAAALIAVLASYVGQLGSRLDVYSAKLSGTLDGVQAWFGRHHVDTSAFFSDFVNVGRITSYVKSFLGSMVNASSNVFLMVMIVLFMLAQVYSFPRKVYARLHLSERFERGFGEFSDVTRSFLFTKGWLALVATAVCTGVYYAFGVDFALLWGIVFFVLSFIPNFGFVLSVIPPFVVTLLEQGWIKAVIVLAVIVALNTVVDNLIAPRFMSRSVGLSMLAIFLSVIVWAWILGPVGALISIPLTLMVKLLFFDSYESTRSISLFLTGGQEMLPVKERKRRNKEDCAVED